MSPSDAVLLGLWPAIVVAGDLYLSGTISFLVGW